MKIFSHFAVVGPKAAFQKQKPENSNQNQQPRN